MVNETEFDRLPKVVLFLHLRHDKWTVVEQPAVVVDFQGIVDYSRHLYFTNPFNCYTKLAFLAGIKYFNWIDACNFGL